MRFHAEKNGMCTGKKKCEKQIYAKHTQNYKILEFTEFCSVKVKCCKSS